MQLERIMRYYRRIGTIGTILAATGLIGLIIGPSLFEYMLNSQLKLAKNKLLYELWRVNPIPLEINIYFFNWTNPQDLRNSSIKPKFQELGPYKFHETKEKVNVTWNDNGTVSFRQLRRWYFDEENSNGTARDQITTLNAVAAVSVTFSPVTLCPYRAAAYQARRFSYFIQKAISFTLGTFMKDIYITKTIGELLFDGYQDNLIDLAKSLPAFGDIEMPPMDKFGWFYTRNGSIEFDGIFNMGTGEKDLPLGVMDRWNTHRTTKYFEESCAKVRGSAGEFWPQKLKHNDTLSAFSTDICREIFFDFEDEVAVQNIPGFKYSAGERTLDNGTLYPENKCYCNGECVPSGLLNISSCRYGAPGFISFPHFYLADPYYLNHFEGLSPEKDKHEVSIILEPKTGIPMTVVARLQANILIQPNKHISLFKDVPKLFFPVLWAEQKVTLSNDWIIILKILLYTPGIAKILSIIMLACGSVILVALAIIGTLISTETSSEELKRKYLTKEEEPLNDNAELLKNDEKGKKVIKLFQARNIEQS